MPDLYEGERDARQTDAPRPQGKFRRRYRALGQAEIDAHDRIKDAAELLLAQIERAYRIAPEAGDPEVQRERGRAQALATTKLEEAVMWAIKGVTA